MGGFGSGEWFRLDKKQTVEDSLVIATGEFRNRLFNGAAGQFVWNWAGGRSSSIGYAVTHDGDRPTITLKYRFGDGDDISISVRMEVTPTAFDGRRWWFTCPLAADGVPCARRIGKLYLPPGARYFGCRTCYRLTYQSCQEAHRLERRFTSVERIERRLATLISRAAIE